MNTNMDVLLPKVKTVLPKKKLSSRNIYWQKDFLQEYEGDMLIDCKKGVIKKIAKQILPPPDCRVLEEYRGKIVLPGFIDPHVHFRSPGNEKAENWHSASLAALFAGITSVLDMPNTSPPTVNAASLGEKQKLIQKSSLINYGIFMGVTARNAQEVFKNRDSVAFKVYLGSTTGNLLMDNIDLLENSFAKSRPPLICFHSEKESIIQENKKKLYPLTTPELHSRVRSEQAAVEATREILCYADSHNVNFHICHVSTAQEMQLLQASSLSWEATPHHIFCSTENYKQGGFLWKCNPPLRDKETQEQMYNFLLQEKIPMIATDHAPHKWSDKIKDKAQNADKEPASGIPSLQVGTHFILNEVFRGNISLPYASWLLSASAALRFGLQGRGFAREGFAADLAVIDAEQEWTFTNEQVLSECGWTPFAGFSFLGKVQAAIVAGRIYNTDELLALQEKTQFQKVLQDARVTWLK